MRHRIMIQRRQKSQSYTYLCLRQESKRQVLHRKLNIYIQIESKRDLWGELEDVIVIEKIIAFQRYGFICRVQKKNESLEQFHAEVVELASKADCGDKEDEKVRDRFTAHLLNENLSEELLVETHTHRKKRKNEQLDAKMVLNSTGY